MEFCFDYKIEKIEETVREILLKIPDRSFIQLKGEMGTGKTTLAKEFLKVLGVVDNITSPTFTFVNEYVKGDQQFYHIDCYRIKNLKEALDLGLTEILESDSWRFVEWAEKIEEILPDKIVLLKIENLSPDSRRLTLTV